MALVAHAKEVKDSMNLIKLYLDSDAKVVIDSIQKEKRERDDKGKEEER